MNLLITGLILLFMTLKTYAEINDSFQFEFGFDSIYSSQSGGLASSNLGSIGFERQELDTSDLGYYFAARKNFSLSENIFVNLGGSFSLNTYYHTIYIRQNSTDIKRETQARTLSLEQKIGYNYDFGNFVLRPYVGVGISFQQVETKTTVINSSYSLNENPSSTDTDYFFFPMLGVEGFYQNWGLGLNYRTAVLSTPSTSIVTGNTKIEEGFDNLSILNFSMLYIW